MTATDTEYDTDAQAARLNPRVSSTCPRCGAAFAVTRDAAGGLNCASCGWENTDAIYAADERRRKRRAAGDTHRLRNFDAYAAQIVRDTVFELRVTRPTKGGHGAAGVHEKRIILAGTCPFCGDEMRDMYAENRQLGKSTVDKRVKDGTRPSLADGAGRLLDCKDGHRVTVLMDERGFYGWV